MDKWSKLSIYMQGKVPLSFCNTRARLPRSQQLAHSSAGETQCTHGLCRVQHPVRTSSVWRCLLRCCDRRPVKQLQAAQGPRLQGHFSQEKKLYCIVQGLKGGLPSLT